MLVHHSLSTDRLSRSAVCGHRNNGECKGASSIATYSAPVATVIAGRRRRPSGLLGRVGNTLSRYMSQATWTLGRMRCRWVDWALAGTIACTVACTVCKGAVEKQGLYSMVAGAPVSVRDC